MSNHPKTFVQITEAVFTCSEPIIETPERCDVNDVRSAVFIFNFEMISQICSGVSVFDFKK